MTREEAIDVLKCNYPSSCFEELCKAVDIAIKALSAQPDRKKGKWIRLDEYPNDVSVKCSECGVTLEDWMMGAFYNYCPNCGADMRGGEDE